MKLIILGFLSCSLQVRTPMLEQLLESKPLDLSRFKDVAGVELETQEVSASITLRNSKDEAIMAYLELYSAGCSSTSEQVFSGAPMILKLHCDNDHHYTLRCEIR